VTGGDDERKAGGRRSAGISEVSGVLISGGERGVRGEQGVGGREKYFGVGGRLPVGVSDILFRAPETTGVPGGFAQTLYFPPNSEKFK
jgi:hypothetical protein